MKHYFLIFSAFLVLSCNSNSETDATVSNETTEQNVVETVVEVELNKSKPSTFLTQEMLQIAFEQSKLENLDFTDDGKCVYMWSVGNLSYTVSFQFYFPDELDEEKSEKMFSSLINGYTLEKDMPVELPNIGDKAIWSQLGGGQFIAKKGNDILILNMDIINLDGFVQLGINDESTRNNMIKIGSDLLIQIISKI